jgi:hypothetical protein
MHAQPISSVSRESFIWVGKWGIGKATKLKGQFEEDNLSPIGSYYDGGQYIIARGSYIKDSVRGLGVVVPRCGSRDVLRAL